LKIKILCNFFPRNFPWTTRTRKRPKWFFCRIVITILILFTDVCVDDDYHTHTCTQRSSRRTHAHTRARSAYYSTVCNDYCCCRYTATTTTTTTTLQQLLLYSTSQHWCCDDIRSPVTTISGHQPPTADSQQSARPNMTSPSAAPSAPRCYVPRSVIVAVVAALASCTDAATVMTRMKGETRFTIIVFRPSYLNTCPSAATGTKKNNNRHVVCPFIPANYNRQ